MRYLTAHLTTISLPTLGFAVGSLILAYQPLLWLVDTWRDPSYPTSGIIYLPLILGLILWSVTSPVVSAKGTAPRRAVILLICAAVLRLISQVAAINVIGGIALALDIYAILTLLRLPERARSVSPFWVSVLFLFCLPFERILQRLLGYPLQEASAFGACKTLGLFFDDLICEGVRLQVEGKDVLVDLPCSGTIGLMLSLAALAALNALYHPTLRQIVVWTTATLGLSLLGNTLRISLLATGLVYEEATGINVMAQPLHDLIGYATIALSLAPVLWLYRPEGARAPFQADVQPRARIRSNPSSFQKSASLGFVLIACGIVFLPRQALDVSKALADTPLPIVLNGSAKKLQDLTAIESAYFERYGGSAQKALYGPMALTMVRTTSPLRHLHAPDDCLRGLGYRVEFLGTRFEPVPTALYKATSSDGRAWQVAVTFKSNTGRATSNVAEAIWLWLQNPKTEWTSIQRITPWALQGDQRQGYEAATLAALNLSTH
ncbi:MAG: exosortase T [Pseudomonadota bacterium]